MFIVDFWVYEFVTYNLTGVSFVDFNLRHDTFLEDNPITVMATDKNYLYEIDWTSAVVPNLNMTYDLGQVYNTTKKSWFDIKNTRNLFFNQEFIIMSLEDGGNI